MSVSAAQAAAFYRELVTEDAVWTIRDEDGYPAPINGSGVRAQPFWSKRSRAERILTQVAVYDGFTLHKIPLNDFLTKWLPGLAKDGLLVGLNWSGQNATGYDIEPETVADRLRAQLRN